MVIRDDLLKQYGANVAVVYATIKGNTQGGLELNGVPAAPLSIGYIGSCMGASRSTVQRAIQVLIDNHYIEKIQLKKGVKVWYKVLN